MFRLLSLLLQERDPQKLLAPLAQTLRERQVRARHMPAFPLLLHPPARRPAG